MTPPGFTSEVNARRTASVVASVDQPVPPSPRPCGLPRLLPSPPACPHRPIGDTNTRLTNTRLTRPLLSRVERAATDSPHAAPERKRKRAARAFAPGAHPLRGGGPRPPFRALWQ
eukprot:326131-Chlamydomonas_euryale.AAC.2